jgi:hypothetical protein
MPKFVCSQLHLLSHTCEWRGVTHKDILFFFLLLFLLLMYVFYSFLFSCSSFTLLLLLVVVVVVVVVIKYRSSELGWDSLVSIATRYSVGDPGIECRWGRDFSGPGVHPASIKWIPSLFPGSKAAGALHWASSPCVAPRFKREQSCIVTSYLCLCGLLYGEIYLYVFLFDVRVTVHRR